MGCSILYHLAKLGWTDSLLLEQYQLTHGSTWHSAGLVGQLRSSISLTRMMQYSVGLYAELKELTGNDPGWHQLGGLRLASSQPRLEEIRRQAAWAKTFGLPMEIVERAGGAGALPADEHRRRARRGVHPRRRLPRPEPAHVLARRRRAPRRRADRDARPRHRHRDDGRPRHRGRDRSGTHRMRGRRRRGRHVRTRARAHGRRRPADHPVRPSVPDHRAVRPAARAAADAARPGQPRLLPHRGRRPRHGRLRAQARAVGARRHPGRVRGEAPAARSGIAWRSSSRMRSRACPRWRTPR